MFRHLAISVLALTILFSGCTGQPVDAETQFWKWFAANEKQLYEQKEAEGQLFNDLSMQLTLVNHNLTFEFSPIGADGVKEFSVSAAGLRQYFPAVLSLVSKAPKLKRWKINAFRQRAPGDNISITIDNNLTVSYSDIYFRYAIDSGKISVELNVRNYSDSAIAKNAVFILLDGLIGEYDMETQIGGIEMIRLDSTKIPSLLPITKLRDIVDSNKQK